MGGRKNILRRIIRKSLFNLIRGGTPYCGVFWNRAVPKKAPPLSAEKFLYWHIKSSGVLEGKYFHNVEGRISLSVATIEALEGGDLCMSEIMEEYAKGQIREYAASKIKALANSNVSFDLIRLSFPEFSEADLKKIIDEIKKIEKN